MKKFCLVAVLFGAASAAMAQDDAVTLDDVIQSAQQWAKENLDENALHALGEVNEERVKQFLAEFQKRFQGEYVLDVAQLKSTAQAIVPLLEAHEETLPYTIWLKTRLDYLDVAEELRLVIPTPKTEPGKPPPPRPAPKPQMLREVWVEEVKAHPVPKAAQPYVLRLKPIFAAQKVPPELVWIAEVESSFDPRARSPVGAAGLFQLMPATAKQYGLKTTWPFDQRVRPEESARAAAQYLAALYKRFGDWRLVLAAYNAGEGTVQNLLKRRKAKTFDEIATRLPAETQMYVPKVEAVLLKREGVRLSELR
jgi:membrane-bound lytic murein transglycosylase D